MLPFSERRDYNTIFFDGPPNADIFAVILPFPKVGNMINAIEQNQFFVVAYMA
jgi:hypothetical protein